MQIEALFGVIQQEKTPVVVVGIFQGAGNLEGAAAEVDASLNGQISRLFKAGIIKGKRDEVSVIHCDGRIPSDHVVTVGLGERSDFGSHVLKRASASVARKVRDLGAETFSTALHTVAEKDLDVRAATEAVVLGTLMGLYQFKELKSIKPDGPDVKQLKIVESDPARLSQVTKGIASGQVIAESICFARDLTNLPANLLTPTRMSEIGQDMAKTCGLKATILSESEIEGLGMNAFLSVARGSQQQPKLIILEHNATRTDLPAVALVGKAVTFDSGGISLKGSSGMEAMKGDMAGGAAVMGAMRAAGLLGLPVRAVGLIPATENLPDGKASKPGDIYRSLKGLTIEIISTDAEGRLCLADALTYAKEFKPDAIYDMATLTGACAVALGTGAAGVMGDERLTEVLQQAADRSGEKVWPLPLFEEYDEQIKSDAADVKNSGGRGAGASTAGCFLRKFVPEGIPWAHIDIAGVSMESKGKPETPKGASGYGVNLFVELLRHWTPGVLA